MQARGVPQRPEASLPRCFRAAQPCKARLVGQECSPFLSVPSPARTDYRCWETCRLSGVTPGVPGTSARRLRGRGDLVARPDAGPLPRAPEHIAELLGADERDYETLDAGWAFKRLIGNSVMRSQGADGVADDPWSSPRSGPARYADTRRRWSTARRRSPTTGETETALMCCARCRCSPSGSWSAHCSATTWDNRPARWVRRCRRQDGRSAPNYGGSGSSCRRGCAPNPGGACSPPSRPSTTRSTGSSTPARQQDTDTAAVRTC